MKAQDLINEIDKLLMPEGLTFKDYCPNGLQVTGKDTVSSIATAVTASQYVCRTAGELGCDLLLVHHGIFWNNQSSLLTGQLYGRVAPLIKHDINLLAYHLPLDAHPEHGNNAALGSLMDWPIDRPLTTLENGEAMGYTGQFKAPCELGSVIDALGKQLQHKPLVINGNSNQKVCTIAWCTGAAGDLIQVAAEQGADVFVTGELSERHFHDAQESGITVLAAGHHATERYGVQAVGEWLSQRHGLPHRFIDEINTI